MAMLKGCVCSRLPGIEESREFKEEHQEIRGGKESELSRT
jgi:hypothetical protein